MTEFVSARITRWFIPSHFLRMNKPKTEKEIQNLRRLDAVTATIVNEMGEIGLYHYNKLTYLFEYFHIKNLGERYTGEFFIKQVHGPVISGYKKQIEGLASRNIVDVDIPALKSMRVVDGDGLVRVPIRKTQNTGNHVITDDVTRALLVQIVAKFGNMPKDDLENFVYRTPPVDAYVKSIFRREIGGRILKDNSGINSFKTTRAKGLAMAQKHLAKYPKIDLSQKESLEKEFQPLIGLST